MFLLLIYSARQSISVLNYRVKNSVESPLKLPVYTLCVVGFLALRGSGTYACG